MKKLQALFLILVVILWANYPLIVWAADTPFHAFSGTDPVEACDVDAESILTDCETGGSGWSGNWLATAGNIHTEVSNCIVANCVDDAVTNDYNVYRTFAAAASGSMTFFIARERSTAGNLTVDICADGTTSCITAGKFTIFFNRTTFAVVLQGVTNATIGEYPDGGEPTTTGLTQVKVAWGADATALGCTDDTYVAAKYGAGDYSCVAMRAGNDPGAFTIQDDDGDSFSMLLDEISGSAASGTPAVGAGRSSPWRLW